MCLKLKQFSAHSTRNTFRLLKFEDNSFKMEKHNIVQTKKEEINYVYEKPKSACNIFALINEEYRRNASVRYYYIVNRAV
jgi:hypothetical protein